MEVEVGFADSPEKVAFLEERRDIAGKRADAELTSAEKHVRKPRMDRKLRHASAMIRERPLWRERPQTEERFPRLRKVGNGWLVKELQPGSLDRAPPCKIQTRRGQVCHHDLRRCKRWKQGMLLLCPEPVAEAGSKPAGAAAALIGSGA